MEVDIRPSVWQWYRALRTQYIRSSRHDLRAVFGSAVPYSIDFV